TTYQIGSDAVLGPLTTGAVYFHTMPYAGTVKKCYFVAAVTGTLGSSGSTTVRVRNNTAATTENVTTSLAMTAATNRANNAAMTLPFSAGDELYIEIVTPTWVTNPTNVFYNSDMTVEFN